MSILTHWGRVTHICVGKLTIIDSDNGLSPGRRQAIIWTNAEILLIGPLGTNINEILISVQTFSFKKMHLKMSSAKWRLCCLGLNVLNTTSCMYKVTLAQTYQRHVTQTRMPRHIFSFYPISNISLYWKNNPCVFLPAERLSDYATDNGAIIQLPQCHCMQNISNFTTNRSGR